MVLGKYADSRICTSNKLKDTRPLLPAICAGNVQSVKSWRFFPPNHKVPKRPRTLTHPHCPKFMIKQIFCERSFRISKCKLYLSRLSRGGGQRGRPRGYYCPLGRGSVGNKILKFWFKPKKVAICRCVSKWVCLNGQRRIRRSAKFVWSFKFLQQRIFIKSNLIFRKQI